MGRGWSREVSEWFKKVHLLVFVLLVIKVAAASNNKGGFTFNGNLQLGGVAEISPDGLFTLNNKSPFELGHAFYSSPLSFKNSSSNGKCLSFSTTFVFAIVSPEEISGHGMAFVISPSKDMPGAMGGHYIGLFNVTSNGDPSNHIVAIELDTSKSPQFEDIDNNHVGIDINGMTSVKSATAGYFTNDDDDDQNGKQLKILTLASGKKMQVWVDYDAIGETLNVTLSPVGIPKPQVPLLSLGIDLSTVIEDQMYVGFSSGTGIRKQYAYVLGWSFQLNGQAQELDLSSLPSLPNGKQSKKKQIILAIVVSLTGLVLVSITIFIILLYTRRRKAKFTEILEDWEIKYGPHRFPYKDLYLATKGFKEKNLIGKGGFGQVYIGVLPTSNIQVAVKRISHGSKQGMKEFIAEIATIGRLRHPNLVRLLGYCRRKGELLLVYDYMPNTSLDKFIFNKKSGAATTLNWQQRFNIIKQVASGLAYLHEEWVEVIIHRDIKASNVLLDGELNGKLGDFGLARCINHAQDPHTTNLAGTLGYIAPELARNGKATTSTDVFAFGAFCLEVACGRRPVELHASPEQVILVDWALECWNKEEILKIIDSRVQVKNDLMVKEMDLVLKVGLLCSHPVVALRPSMSQVVHYLNGQASLPENLDAHLQAREQWKGTYHLESSRLLNDSGPSLTISEPFIDTGR